jgi:hypothetical protein
MKKTSPCLIAAALIALSGCAPLPPRSKPAASDPFFGEWQGTWRSDINPTSSGTLEKVAIGRDPVVPNDPQRASFDAKLTNAVVPGFIARGMLKDAKLNFTSAGGSTLEFILYGQDRIEATYFNPNNRDRGTWSLTRVSSPVVEKVATAPMPSSAPTGAVASSAAGSNLSPGLCEGKWRHPSFGEGKVYLTVKTVKGADVTGTFYGEGSATYQNRDLPLTGKVSVEDGTEKFTFAASPVWGEVLFRDGMWTGTVAAVATSSLTLRCK